MRKRGAVTLLLATGGLILLLAFKTPTELPGATGTDAQAAAATPAGLESPAATLDPNVEGLNPTAAPTAPAAEEPVAATDQDGTVTGNAIGTRWGTVQVQVTIADGRLVDVSALQMPTDDHHSIAISERAEPVLRSAALEAQSADITVLSGATYTSLAYAQSLQSALDEAGA
jgi:uncharacterized protein with FMN-binding domain